jgi:RNA polymerase sigma factor (TIGR02999 family)
MADVTRLLDAAASGDPKAAAELLPLVYEELRQLAAARMAAERADHTLSATGLVHEAYLRLVGAAVDGESPDARFGGRAHFFGAAAEAMRRILIDRARQRHSQKRGGGLRRVELDAAAPIAAPDDQAADDLLALDQALRAFEAEDPDKARLVKLRYFAGLSIREAADALSISPATAKRHWVYARSWLYGRLHGQGMKDEG